MTPNRPDLLEYGKMDAGIEFTIADGMKLRVAGRGTARLLGLDRTRIKMMDVLFMPGLDRRLLLVGKLEERGLDVEFQCSSCVIWTTDSAIALGRKVGTAYMLKCDQDKARLFQYAGVGTQW
ncbi:hypothetical protein PR001_g10841 [Phytophthora rubi]|uniref:Retrovirus-related Pol polyprotein from transposon TNT 1-94-like beta-barrel domain-containing protein n=1 Tax=Phytophthora rubi TaxID=129364 RepID=A0A6A3MSY1_9STRA|nr:hypothetical protein PR002_g10605 [Phytophthora rubi]KAE9031924.1 hypothetical protein PR001_g10841 [Phytophthora rubi]